MIFHLTGKQSCCEEKQVYRRANCICTQANGVGPEIDEACRKLGISDATFYKWRQKYGGLGPSELRRSRQLEEENNKFERLVADRSLDKAMLQDVPAKKALKP